ncbi:VWA domain-containing protein [Arthrobacter alpinus]|nr:VWA domain-containing protein [Arthrobacter alpinus]
MTGGAYYALESESAVPAIVQKVQATEAALLKGAPQRTLLDNPGWPLGWPWCPCWFCSPRAGGCGDDSPSDPADLALHNPGCAAGGRSYLLTGQGATPARWRYGALVVLVLIAGARPGLVGASAPVANTELNVYFVVDVTPSVAAEDFNGKSPRLDGMKEDIRALATELAGARFSLLTFDSTAQVTMPLTTDATALDTMTQVLTPKAVYISQGSSISVANQLLAQRLAAAAKAHPERPRLVFYLGDGEQTADSAPKPFKENVELIDGGAVLGYGTEAGAKMREFSFSSGSPVVTSWISQKLPTRHFTH